MKTKHTSVEDVMNIKGKSVIFHTDFTVTDESHIERMKKVLDHLILRNRITIIVAKGDTGSYLDQYSRHDYKLIQCSTLQHVIQYFARMQNSMDHIIVANNVVKSMMGRRRFGGLMYVDIGDEIDIPRALPIVRSKAKEVIPTQQHQLTTIESNIPHKPLKYVFVIPSYNNEPYYRKNLDSVVSQTYTNWRIIYVDDASTDRTYELVQKYIQEKVIKDKVKLIRNDKNFKQAYSRYVALKECDDDEICCFVDGDDWLYDTRVLEKTNQLYMRGNVELTYGGMHKFIDGKTGSKCVSKSFSSDVIKNNSYRKQPWSVLPFRTGYARLFKNAPEDYYKDHNGDWLKCSTDMALMWWGLEQCNGKFKCVDFSSYVYNVDASVRFENSYERKNKSKEWNDYRGKVTRRLIQYENPLCVVKQICISPSLKQFDRIKVKYSFVNYNRHSKDSCLFFGVYTQQELNNIKRYNGKAYIMFGGSDTDERIPQSKVILNELLQTQSKYRFVAISKNIESILIQRGFKNVIYQQINLVDTKLFKNGQYDQNSNNIYIYDGTGKIYDGKKEIYNHKLIDELQKELPEYNFLRSSEMNVAYEKMPDVYSKCFIALRLTKQDGNANTVQECEAIGMPVVHNHSEYGLKWKSKEDIKEIIKYNKSNKIYTLNDFTSINIENNLSYEELISNTNGDNINETNFINNIIKNNITLYYNNKFITGNNKLLPQITVSRNKNFSQLINKSNSYLSSIPYIKDGNGLYCITKSMIEAIKDKTSLLYPHVYDKELYDEINSKNVFLHEQSIDKNWYNWASDCEIQKLKLKYFPEDAFVICICGRIAINSYPKSLLEAIKLLRQQGHNIYLLALTKFEVNPYRLTRNLYNEITSYDWVKSFTVNKKDVLNYFRMCDILASTYRDYCNHVGGSNKIKEYLLCDKPILCSRGKERERELGKNYPGLYDCKTCDSVPPLCWTQLFMKNHHNYIGLYNTYFKKYDNYLSLIKKEVIEIGNYISKHIKNNYHNNRVAWALDTSYAGYPFIAKFLDCQLLVYNYRLPYWDNKCPNLYSYLDNKEFVLNELYYAKHLYIFGAMGLRYLLYILSTINKKLSDYKITFFITDHWYMRDRTQNNNKIQDALKDVEELENLVMPDCVPYVIKDGLSFKPYYQHIPFEMKDNINKYKELTVSHSPGLKKKCNHKGTAEIERVCKKLNIKLEIISGCTWEESIKIKQKSHIFVDQIINDQFRKELGIDYFGGIGKSGLEAMKCNCLTITSGYSGSMIGNSEHPAPPVDVVKDENDLEKLLSYYKDNLDSLKVKATKQKEYADKYTSFDFVLNNVDKNIKKIKQIRVSKNIIFFADKMKKKYDFKDYTDINEPVLFFGLYNIDDYNEVKNHRGPIVFLWAGSDARYVIEYLYLRKEAQNIRYRGRHIAISSCVQKRLKSVNINSEFIPICPTEIKTNIQPKGDCVYFYGKGKNYGEELVPEIQKRIPYKIIKTVSNSFSNEELQEIYKKCFIGLRLTQVDGLSNTVIELGLMGRKVVYNCNPLPNAIKYSNIDSIVESINKEYKNKEHNSESIANDMVTYFDKYYDHWLYVST